VTSFVFPDNTVLCNFAAVHRLDLLESVLLGRGRWTEAVAYEAERSSHHLLDLASLTVAGWLGEPIEITDASEVKAVERVRRSVFGGEARAPLKHLGEAQTCFLIKNRVEFKGARWVSDDHESLRYARRQGLDVSETIDLVHEAVLNGQLTPAQGHELMEAMVDEGRHPRTSNSPRDFYR
jgi:predicted nucleic acid-binding protein